MRMSAVRWLAMALVSGCVLALSACGASSVQPGAHAVTTPTATITPTAATAPTATLPPPTPTTGPIGIFKGDPCTATATNDSIAQYLSGNKIVVPSGALVVDMGNAASDGVQHSFDYSFMGVCAKSSTVAAVQSLYLSQMPGLGWTKSATYPAPSDLNAACAASSCWSRDAGNGISQVVAVQKLTAEGANVSYQLTLESYNR